MLLEHKILKALLDRPTYENHRKFFNGISDGMAPWLKTIDWWHENHEGSITVEELYELHVTKFNPVATTKQRELMAATYELLKQADSNPEVIGALIEEKYLMDTFSTIAEKLIRMSEGKEEADLPKLIGELEKLNRVRDTTGQFPPLKTSKEELLVSSLNQGKWKFHLRTWQDMTRGIGPGVFALFAARPNGGKSLAGLSSCFHPEGFAAQGAKIVYFANEEKVERHLHRAICCYSGMDYNESLMPQNRERFYKAYDEFEEKFIKTGQVVFYYESGLNYQKVDALLEEHKPDILIIDQLDKLNVPGDGAVHDKMRVLYTTMRNMSVAHDCAIIGVSQASDAATGKRYFGFDALEGSKTGKAAELDLIICIGADNLQNDDGMRYFWICKNKLTGIEKIGTYMIDKEKSRMVD